MALPKFKTSKSKFISIVQQLLAILLGVAVILSAVQCANRIGG